MARNLMLVVLSSLIIFSCIPPLLVDEPAAQSRGVAAPFSWSSSGRLIDPKSDSTHNCVSIKDPTVVNSGGNWHIYATIYNSSKSTWSMVYLSFSDWNSANSATQYYMDSNSSLTGYKCAPHVFYSSNKGKWYLVYQTQPPAYSTATTIGGPSNWSGPTNFYSSKPAGAPSLWIDFWVISDSTNYYLFCSGDDGKLYRAQTTRNNFPGGFGSFTTVLSFANKNDLFEGACVYKINGQNKYLLLNECIGANGRYYKAFTASSLTSSWTAIAGSESNPFCGKANVTSGTIWTKDFSHGEMLRAGTNEYMEINDGTLQFLYQGSTGTASSYELIPWSLGLLTQTSSTAANTLVVRARGTSGSENLDVNVNGVKIGSYTLTTSLTDKTFTTSQSGGITVCFTNDASGRDVQVDYIKWNGTIKQSEAQSYNTGAWDSAASKCGKSYSEWLHCNGCIGY